MRGLMMDYQLTIPAMLDRAEQFFGDRAVVTRRPDRSLHRYTYRDFALRARKLAGALQQLGVRKGDRVATLCWNHHQHLEAYFGIPLAGGVLHTLNLRLHPDDLTYIVTHGGDTAIVVDDVLLPLLQKFRDRIGDVKVIVVSHGTPVPEGMLEYEALISVGAAAESPKWLRESDAAAMCYTTGTTGKPKGVLYSHRAIALHSLALSLMDTFGISHHDVVLPVVPMFHANAWGLPFACALFGAAQVFPGPHLDPVSLLELYQSERVTLTAGVPTIWMGLLQVLDDNRGAYDLSSMRMMVVGGSACPRAMIEAFDTRHGLQIVHAWGMTETAPLGSVCHAGPELDEAPAEARYTARARQGRPAPFIEVRARNENGIVPWDGATMGELEVRGPWVANTYFRQDAADRFTEDGWFRTGDIVTIDSGGSIQIQDRAKDLIKSGGEWISSVALENAIMAHPAVAEAAVIGLAHPKWQERPLAAVVVKEGQTLTQRQLLEFLTPQFPRWWLPDAVEFVSAIPRSSAGKFMKNALRDQFKGYEFPEAAAS
jgi:fatty-acyl-CoA synthase